MKSPGKKWRLLHFHVVSVCSVPVACRYLKDDEIDSNRQDKLVEIHIAPTIVLTVAGGVFSRMSVLVNKWIDEQPFIVAAYIALALSVFGVVIGKAIDFGYII